MAQPRIGWFLIHLFDLLAFKLPLSHGNQTHVFPSICSKRGRIKAQTCIHPHPSTIEGEAIFLLSRFVLVLLLLGRRKKEQDGLTTMYAIKKTLLSVLLANLLIRIVDSEPWKVHPFTNVTTLKSKLFAGSISDHMYRMAVLSMLCEDKTLDVSKSVKRLFQILQTDLCRP